VKRKDFLDAKKETKKAKASYKPSQCSSAACHECQLNEQSAGKAPQSKTEQSETCRVAHISTMEATMVFGTNTAFHATGRFARSVTTRAPRTARVLMDPGADVNLVRADIVTGVTKASALKVLNTRHSPTDLFNNGIKIGHVETEYELEFTLDTPAGVPAQRYTGWFMAWDAPEEEAILGAEFNESQGFTNYHQRLIPHDAHRRKKKDAKEPTQDPALDGAGVARQWELDHRPREALMPGLKKGGQREACPHQQRIVASPKPRIP
jgi:hypothetical protein